MSIDLTFSNLPQVVISEGSSSGQRMHSSTSTTSSVTTDAKGIEKGGYVLNRNVMTVADLARIINSDQVQSKLRAIRTSQVHHDLRKKNPLKNRKIMKRLNPFNEKLRRGREEEPRGQTQKESCCHQGKEKGQEIQEGEKKHLQGNPS